MPSSSWVHIPQVVSIVRQVRPTSILDIGIGFGKWGQLFREYTDIWSAAEEPARYEKMNWRVRIDGIEGFEPYVTPHHRYLYDNVYVGDAFELIERLGKYDMVFMGDVIEHFEKPQGMRLLRSMVAHANKVVVVTTPSKHVDQDAVFNNALEVHRSDWTADDFQAVARGACTVIGDEILMCTLAADERIALPTFDLEVRRAGERRTTWQRVKRGITRRLSVLQAQR